MSDKVEQDRHFYIFGCRSCRHIEEQEVEFLQPIQYGVGWLISTRLKPRRCSACGKDDLYTEDKPSELKA